MGRYLIWKETAPGCEYDIFNVTNYDTLYNHVETNWNGVCKNWGNRLWFQGIYSAIDTNENEYDFITDDMTIDYINQTYEKIILPMANIFYYGFLDSMRKLSDIFEKITVPTYVVVCGVQADGYDSLNDVISSIGKDATRFIKAIYNTGGEFALRGYFTKEFFDRLGFSSAVVTGCPSMYQLGKGFKVDDRKGNIKNINPIFNGYLKPYEKLMYMYKSSVFIDQCTFFEPLFSEKYLDKTDFNFQRCFSEKYGISAAQLIAEGRIVMAADMNDWLNYIRYNNFNYAFGSRIHGTIMALLSGVPATIITTDSRTKEMAEFFDIPYEERNASHVFAKEEFEKSYNQMNYTVFNKTFDKKFSIYEEFLRKHGIVSQVNTDNRFFYEKEPIVYSGSVNQKMKYQELAKCLEKNHKKIKMMNNLQKITRRILR